MSNLEALWPRVRCQVLDVGQLILASGHQPLENGGRVSKNKG